jgi:hypothetical protein
MNEHHLKWAVPASSRSRGYIQLVAAAKRPPLAATGAMPGISHTRGDRGANEGQGEVPTDAEIGLAVGLRAIRGSIAWARSCQSERREGDA